MKEEFLANIDNPAVKREVESLFNNGAEFDQERMSVFIENGIRSHIVQTFPTAGSERILKNLNMDLRQAKRIFLIIKAERGLYWKSTEIVNSISEQTDADVLWNFQPVNEMNNVIKVVALSS
ncbi:MAG: hypothetical protein ACLFS3_01035 [Candidatus Aenigmatarchaeota archaeon]